MRTVKPLENPIDVPPREAEADRGPGSNVGRMTITLTSNGTGRPIPSVSFDPVGLFTPGLLGDHLQTFAAAVEHAQAAERNRRRRL